MEAEKHEYHPLSGLTYVPAFISKQREAQLIETINQGEWNTALKRRTQHYGYAYSYEKVNTLLKAAPIPPAFEDIQKQIEDYLSSHEKSFCSFEQLIINEYQPGQGISAHIDNKILFGDIVAGLSLGSDAPMVFEKGTEKHTVLLERRSLILMEGEARNHWKHSIPARKKDQGIARGVRLSMTWRSVRVKQE